MSDKEKKSAYDKLTPQRQKLVDTITANLENNHSLWRQGWRVTGAPVSAITGKRYNGVNRLFLSAATMERGYSDNRWLTYNQMKEKGWDFIIGIVIIFVVAMGAPLLINGLSAWVGA